MLLALFAVAAGCAVGFWRGPHVTEVFAAGFRSIALLVSGAVLEGAGALAGGGTVALDLTIAGYVVLVAFAVVNAGTTGMILVALGLVANMSVFVVDGSMPVQGLTSSSAVEGRHRPVRPGDHLITLADVVHLPIVDEVVSAGDIVLCLGVATIAAGVTRTQTARRRQGVLR